MSVQNRSVRGERHRGRLPTCAGACLDTQWVTGQYLVLSPNHLSNG